jgi:hypothetical protein
MLVSLCRAMHVHALESAALGTPPSPLLAPLTCKVDNQAHFALVLVQGGVLAINVLQTTAIKVKHEVN